MKSFIITESEKNRILNMHKSATSKHYLMEQGCVNVPPTISKFVNFMAPPTGFMDHGKTTIEIANGEYSLKPAEEVQEYGYYTIWDTNGCWTGYGLSIDDKSKTNITIDGGTIEGGNSWYEKIWELKGNKYPKVTDSDKIIRN